MADTSLRTEERIAGDILARQLGGIVIPRDVPGAPAATHEFDVRLPSGRLIAVEVTSATDGPMEALHRAAFGQRWDAPTLAHDWWLVLPMDGSFNVRKMASKVIPHLEVLDASEGIEHFAMYSVPAGIDQAEANAIQGVLGLGVRTAARLGSPESGQTAQLLFSLGGSSGSDFGLLNNQVTHCAEKKLAKLLAADGDERHLFVWMRHNDAELAMATLPPPDSTPSVPAGIDVVWVATTSGQPFGELWRLAPPGRWEPTRDGP